MELANIDPSAFLGWLTRSTVQVSVLVCLVLTIKAVVRGKLAARWHYCLWLLVVARMIMPWAPQTRVSMFNLPWLSDDKAVTDYVLPVETDFAAPAQVSEAAVTDAAAEPVSLEEPIGTGAPPTKDALPTLKMMACAVWAAGAAALAIWVLWGNFALLKLVRRERCVTDSRVLEILEDCKERMNVRTPLGVAITSRVGSPSLFGFVRPRLLLPAAVIETLSDEELRNVFLHELAHLKRHDIGIGWLVAALQAVHWFNPLVWLAFGQMRADRELACDALALSYSGAEGPKAYGATIVHLLERFSERRLLQGMAGVLEDKGQLKRRIKMIARYRNGSYRWSILAAVVLAAVAVVGLTDGQTTARDNDVVAADRVRGDVDLAIGDLVILPYRDTDGREKGYTAQFHVINNGNSAARKFKVDFYHGDIGDREPETYQAGPLYAGDSWQGSSEIFDIKWRGYGKYSLVVDANEEVPETDEKNNVAKLEVGVFGDGQITVETLILQDRSEERRLESGKWVFKRTPRVSNSKNLSELKSGGVDDIAPLIGIWRGTATDKPEDGGSTYDLTLVLRGEAGELAGDAVGSFVRGGKAKLENVRKEPTWISFEVQHAIENLRMQVTLVPQSDGRLRGEALPIGMVEDRCDIVLTRLPEDSVSGFEDIGGYAQEGQPEIVFEKTVHDFNEVGTGTQNVCEFRFRNAGGGVLKITEVSKTCGCTLFALEKKEYGPGESGVLKVSYQATSVDALISKHLYVYSNDPINPKVELTIRAKVVMRIDISPKRLSFSLAEDAESPELTISEKEGQPFSIKKFTSAPSGITADFDPNQKGAKFVLKPKVDRNKLNRGLSGYIEVELMHPECPKIQIPFSLLARFKVTPPTMVLFRVEPGVSIRRQVWVLNNYGRDFEIESITSEQGSVKVLNREKSDSRYSIGLEITPPERDERQPIFSDTVNIKIKDDETLEVICRGLYKRK